VISGSNAAAKGAAAESSMPSISATSTPAQETRLLTRAQRGIHKPRIYTHGTVRYDSKKAFLTSIGEPNSLEYALENFNWKKAMDLEYDALLKNKTWHLVPPMKDRNIVGCKWVYKIKRKQDDILDRY
jgi:hypothetical protein